MLPILNIPLENDNADRGKENGLSVLLFPGEKNHMVFSRERTKKRDVAKADGYYTLNGGFFKAKKGQPLPEVYDAVFYDDDEELEQSQAVTGSEHRAGRIAKGNDADEAPAEEAAVEEQGNDEVVEESVADDEVAAEVEKPKAAAKGAKKA